MKTCYRTAIRAVALAALLPLATANAQIEDLTKKGQQPGAAGSLGNLGSSIGSAMPGLSLSSGSMGNVAGLLEFCIKNNFLGSKEASPVQEQLMGKLPGGQATPAASYADGAKGLLKSSDGKQLDLSGGGLKAEASKQVCDRILAQAKSML